MRALTELKKECFERIGVKICYCCYSKNPKQLIIHHLSYTKNSIIYNKFENNDDGRLKYYANLLDEIKINITNFLIFCINCHNKLEKLLRLSYNEVFNLAKNDKLSTNLIRAYNETCLKRGMKILENPNDEIILPFFILKLKKEIEEDFITAKNLKQFKEFSMISILYYVNRIKEFSFDDLAFIGVLSDIPSNYLTPFPDHVQAAKLLESVREIKKDEKIKYIHIYNQPFVKPPEMTRKDEINVSKYISIIEKELKDLFPFDIDTIFGKPKQTVSEYFYD